LRNDAAFTVRPSTINMTSDSATAHDEQAKRFDELAAPFPPCPMT
jgi:hypothetical protein